MRNKDKKDPSRLHEWGGYEFEGSVADLIITLKAIVKQHPKATISYELDYGCCYYESDSPSHKFTIRSK